MTETASVYIAHRNYAAIRAINWSTAKHALVSPLAYQHALRSDDDTPAMRLGRALHALLPTREEFDSEWLVYTETADRRAKKYAEFEAANPGREILTISEHEKAEAMRAAVMAHPRALHWIGPLDQGIREKTLTWVDPSTGLDCKGRVDWIGATHGEPRRRPVEFKTTSAKSASQFFWQAKDLGYTGQAAFYDGGLRANGYDVAPPVILVVQSGPPYDVWPLPMSAETLAGGRRLFEKALATIQLCLQTGEWPGAAGSGDIEFEDRGAPSLGSDEVLTLGGVAVEF